jgi:hypothetical protein
MKYEEQNYPRHSPTLQESAPPPEGESSQALFGLSLTIFGVGAIVLAFLIPTAKDGIHNSGLLQNRELIMMVGCTLFISGVILRKRN